MPGTNEEKTSSFHRAGLYLVIVSQTQNKFFLLFLLFCKMKMLSLGFWKLFLENYYKTVVTKYKPMTQLSKVVAHYVHLLGFNFINAIRNSNKLLISWLFNKKKLTRAEYTYNAADIITMNQFSNSLEKWTTYPIYISRTQWSWEK